MPEVASAPPIAPATVASATTAAMAPKRRLPDDPELGSAFDAAASSPRQARSPGDMIINLPGIRGTSGSALPAVSGLTGSTLNAFLINVYSPGGTIVSGAYNSAVTSGNVILTMQKRRV